jgi:dolichol-phosphate mannosyltransferase
VDLSVVIPVRDERDNLEPLVAELEHVLGSSGPPFEIILVDDGSRDGSGERIAEIARERSGVRALHFRESRGQTAALDAGFKAARGARVVTLDADLQYDPRDISRLVAALSEHDAAVGFRVPRNDGFVRRVSSRVANTVRNFASGDDIIDTGCSLKAFRREALADLHLFSGMHRFLPTLLRLEGRSVVQLPVAHRPRVTGRSKYGIGNRALVGLADLLAVCWMKRRRLGYEIVRREPP